MSPNYLTTKTMIAITGPWIDPDRDRAKIEAYPELGGSLTMIERGHHGLLDTQLIDGPTKEQIAELTVEIDELDGEHDRNARISYGFLDGLGERANDPDEKAKWNGTRDLLFPDGLSINRASYLDQAGGVDSVRARITPEIRQRLDQTIIDGRPLGETVDAWLEAGEKLGEVYIRRSRLQNADDGERISAGDVRKARHFWIRAVKTFQSMLDMVDMDDDTRRVLLTPLQEAQKAARRRSDQEVDEPAVPEEPVVEDGQEPAVEDPA